MDKKEIKLPDSFLTKEQEEMLKKSLDEICWDNYVIGNNVNHPKHYNQHPSGIECIEIVQYYDFCLGNAIKYIWRAGLKYDESKYQTKEDIAEAKIEDLRKAIWYLEREIDLIEKGKEKSKTEVTYDPAVTSITENIEN